MPARHHKCRCNNDEQKMWNFLFGSLLLLSDRHLMTPVWSHGDCCLRTSHRRRCNAIAWRLMWSSFGDFTLKPSWPLHCGESSKDVTRRLLKWPYVTMVVILWLVYKWLHCDVTWVLVTMQLSRWLHNVGLETTVTWESTSDFMLM